MKTVLVVDDTKNIRTLLTTCLELRGYNVISAINGNETIDIVKNQDIDLIFLDIKMPEISGTEVLRRIREIGNNCPVIIMTAFATVKNAVECTKLGAAYYLQKPFTAEKVQNVLNEVFDEKNIINKSKDDVNKVDLEILIRQATMNIEKGYYVEGESILRNALSIDPTNPKIYFLLSEVTEKLGNIDLAERFHKAAEVFGRTSKKI